MSRIPASKRKYRTWSGMTDQELREWSERSALSQIAEGFRAWLPMNGLAAFTGAWGMINGFALFIVLEEKFEAWWIPVGGVVLATLAAAVVEWLRSTVEGHHFGRPTLTRVLSFFMLLIVFELFTYAFHDLSKNWDDWARTFRDIFGAGSLRGILNVVVFAGLWTLLSARLGDALATAVQQMPRLKSGAELAKGFRGIEDVHLRIVTRQSLIVGLRAALKVGLVSIPLIVLAYAILVRLAWATLAMWFDGSGEWRLPGESWLGYLGALLIVGTVGEALSDRKFGFAAFAAFYFGLSVYRDLQRRWRRDGRCNRGRALADGAAGDRHRRDLASDRARARCARALLPPTVTISLAVDTPCSCRRTWCHRACVHRTAPRAFVRGSTPGRSGSAARDGSAD